MAAGLAGGSGNAGAVIHALNKLWNLGLSLEQLMEGRQGLRRRRAVYNNGTGKMQQRT